ncbi:helix-turn-helix domain-containing protein [Rhodovulum sulfidophilum]|uniref:helix-turn-helix domain-containing protein n=1 Tax=Rhodovulum sulfidophilum TaxID=35806 RepID=UPI0009536162|nr:helix-turn-helix domain-containing protein [Rhodovulum sulfidophilum]MBL3552992.1 helix-turn-helix domain-containing protein [Rhodovulum sulfidophilum]OLS48993.1 hypothetical protein BV379_12415 [Rhodovulum sulfidophilum]
MNDAIDSQQEPDAVRAAVQAQIIECLNRFYAMESGMWGKPLDSLIIRTVVQSRMQGKLYDFSALSEALDLPISTLHRKINSLVESGYLRREPVGKSIYIAPTERTSVKFDESFEAMVTTLRRLYRGEYNFDGAPNLCDEP